MRNPFTVANMIPSRFVQGELPGSGQTYGNLWKLAAPSVAELVLTSLIGMVDTQMVSGLGDAAIAAVALVAQPRMLVLSLFMAINVGLTATLARRKGEGRQEAAQHTLRSVLWIMVLASMAITVIAELIAEPLMLFAGANEETLELSCTYFRIFIAITPIQVLLMALCACQRGIGNTKIVMYVNIAGNLVNVFMNYLLI
ncbi:MAG: MATE family efflux transporter, partial [Oscillospiraceae bacterium]|nr:MATE family efflux transporter [Oscillospiraceae bacterium]